MGAPVLRVVSAEERPSALPLLTFDPCPRSYLHARCHPRSELVAWVDPDGLVIACAACEAPVLRLPSGDLVEAVRRLGWACAHHKRGPGDG